MSPRLGFRHSDPRFGFLWATPAQPAARWHGQGEGPVNYFADTPTGAWAEFLRHEGIVDPEDLAGVRRSLWVVELPAGRYASPTLPAEQTEGGLATYQACQAEARRLRAAGATRLQTRSAALHGGRAHGWLSRGGGAEPSPVPRDGMVCVLFGHLDLVGWLAVDAGSPPAVVLDLVRPLEP